MFVAKKNVLASRLDNEKKRAEPESKKRGIDGLFQKKEYFSSKYDSDQQLPTKKVKTQHENDAPEGMPKNLPHAAHDTHTEDENSDTTSTESPFLFDELADSSDFELVMGNLLSSSGEELLERELCRLEHQRRCAERRIHSGGKMLLSRRMSWKLSTMPRNSLQNSPLRACKLDFQPNFTLLPKSFKLLGRRQRHGVEFRV